MRLGTLIAIALAAGAAAAAVAAPDEGACGRIAAACRAAGFVRGGAAGGDGLLVDCLVPLVRGTAPPHKTSKPLPRIDAELVAQCKAENPVFGEANEPTPPTVSQPAAGDPAQPETAAPVPSANGARRPNIVLVLTDDLSWNLVQFMPHVLAMQQAGVTFADFFVTDSLCCPSRASIFTGRYPHNTGVFRNAGSDGGYEVFHARGHERVTFATALTAAGYHTAMLGKYLNGYRPPQHPPAAGWTSWNVVGNGYREFDYNVSEDGTVVYYGDRPEDYLTDVLSAHATRFIRQQRSAPFLIEVATFAPHAPYVPAPRDAKAFPGLHAPQTPAFNAAPDADAPHWLRDHPALSAADIAEIDGDFRKRAQSMLAVDKMIGELQAAVAAIGQAGNTYFVFSSDNGYHMGEHRLRPGKMTAFDTDIHVPLIVTGPGVPKGVTVDEIVENVDLCPTFAELGGAVAPPEVDGRSFVPLLHGQKPSDWRSLALVEHRGPDNDPDDPDEPTPRSGNPTTYEAIRARSFVYVEYADGEREYHDLAGDPDELRNGFASLPPERKAALHASLEGLRKCQGARACESAAGR